MIGNDLETSEVPNFALLYIISKERLYYKSKVTNNFLIIPHLGVPKNSPTTCLMPFDTIISLH